MKKFPSIKGLQGELKRTEVRGGIRYQLTTKEFILQRSLQTYRIRLEHILGVTEISEADLHLDHQYFHAFNTKGGQPYKIVATLLYQVTHQGVTEQKRVSLYTRLSPAFAKQLTELLVAAS